MFITALAGLASCTTPGTAPSLAPRATEAIDPRLPVAARVNDRPVSAALAARLAELVSMAKSGEAAFEPLAARARQLTDGVGPPQSESWVVAQEAVSAAIAARAPTARAIGDIDALGGNALQTQGGLSPADLAAIRQAGAEVAEIDDRQAAAIAAIQQRLGL